MGIKLNEEDITREKRTAELSMVPEARVAAGNQTHALSGLKYELDALANKDFQYLDQKYLPRKLKEKDWLDHCRPRGIVRTQASPAVDACAGVRRGLGALLWLAPALGITQTTSPPSLNKRRRARALRLLEFSR